MKIRVLIEQRAHAGLERRRLNSGEVVEIDNDWAQELLSRGDAEPIAEKPAERAEKRPAAKRESTRSSDPSPKRGSGKQHVGSDDNEKNA